MINQMAYIEQFLSQHIISYYLSTLKGEIGNKSFVDYHNQRNLYSLTWQILLFGESITKTNNRKCLITLINTHLRISYDDLKDTTLPKKEGDSETIQLIKRSLGYVYVQMHQVMVRVILAYLLIVESDRISEQVQTIINQISYIYPALKAEISFNSNEINLTEWFELYLTQLIKEKHPKASFFQFLETLKNQCYMIGPLEKLFNRLIQNREVEQEEKQYTQSVYEDSRSQSMSKIVEKRFNDSQLLRKKKKIVKDRFKNSSTHSNEYITPSKSKEYFVPQTQKTDFWATQQSNLQSQSQSSSLNISKLLKKYKKPPVRTIYHGSTKTFVPKSSNINNDNAQLYIENLTAYSSLTSNDSVRLFDNKRKFSSKQTKSTVQIQDKSQFCVPQTPKQQPLRLSMQKKMINLEGIKKIQRLKI